MSNTMAIAAIAALNIASLGHNNPPEPTPFEAVSAEINDLYGEAKLWLDGEPVKTQEQADALNTLETRIRKAAKTAEENRKAEAKPFDDGKAEVQARYKPVIAKTDDAIAAIKAALKPYLIELARQQEELARKAREEADKKRAEALAAVAARDSANLESREDAEKKIAEAKAADEAASKAASAKAHAKGEGRATGLRTVKRAVMVNEHEAAAWVWVNHRAELMEFTQSLADKAVRSGATEIRGFDIFEEKTL